MRELLAAYLLGVFLVATYSPDAAANWFYAFQSHLFQLQMEAWDE